MSERTTRRVSVVAGLFAGAVTLANIVLLVLGREALDNPEGDLLFLRVSLPLQSDTLEGMGSVRAPTKVDSP